MKLTQMLLRRGAPTGPPPKKIKLCAATRHKGTGYASGHAPGFSEVSNRVDKADDINKL